MNKIDRIMVFSIVFAMAVAMFLTSGCETDSVEGVARNVEIDVTGYYSGSISGLLVERNSGAAITGIDLRQNGASIEGYDNNGQIFRGTIGQAGDSSASFTLQGATTAGGSGVISGQISVSGTSATMSGTWIEEAMSSRVSGTASVTEPQSNLSISPNSSTISTDGNTQTFTASGGDGTYTWSLGNSSSGSISGSGSSVTYTRDSSGSNTITVTSDGDTASASISQP